MTALTTEASAKLIHEILREETPVGEMMMMGAVKQAYDLKNGDLSGLEEGLKHGDALGLFAVSTLGVLRKI
jgi:hypothetical protein